MAYTIHDTADSTRRIENDLRLIADEVRRHDPALRALVLTGGFARGEGAVLGGKPQNDYDLVAVRGFGRSRVPYAALRQRAEALVDLHVDLAPVPMWRLRHVPASIFWYETALRGRVIWSRDGNADVLRRIRVRCAGTIERTEALRLLANRAAGLLLATEGKYETCLQAAKALLAALDTHLMAQGVFPPSQRERWAAFQAMVARGDAPRALASRTDWLAWAFTTKVDPATAARRDSHDAWLAARAAVLDAVPVALRHARVRDLDAYARRDGLIDRLVYLRRSRLVPGARRFASHPSARVRVATLCMLEAAADGEPPNEAAHRILRPLVAPTHRPVLTLDALRQATLQ